MVIEHLVVKLEKKDRMTEVSKIMRKTGLERREKKEVNFFREEKERKKGLTIVCVVGE